MEIFAGECGERVRGVFRALSSVVDETLYTGPLQAMETGDYRIALEDIFRED